MGLFITVNTVEGLISVCTQMTVYTGRWVRPFNPISRSGYISRDNIHEINTWKCPIQTQCG